MKRVSSLSLLRFIVSYRYLSLFIVIYLYASPLMMNNTLISLLALAATGSENQSDRLLTPLSKWQLQRCSTPSTNYCQEDMVNEWLHRNHIRVVDRLPKMDPVVLVRFLHRPCTTEVR